MGSIRTYRRTEWSWYSWVETRASTEIWYKTWKNKSVEIQAIDFIRTSPFVQEEVKRASENIKLTNFARLLGDKSVREILGLKYINSKLSSNLEEEEIAKALGQIILDLSDKDFKVSSIYIMPSKEKIIFKA